MKAKITLILLLLINWSFYAQVKIGDNPEVIDLHSILELESSDKALVISRMTATQMNAITPLEGALVYNSTVNCVFVYNGTSWKSLCNGGTGTGEDSVIKVTTQNTAPTDNHTGDFWINDSLNNAVSIYDGATWMSLDNNPIRGNGIPDATNVPTPISGDLYIDSNTGTIYAYNGSSWIPSNTTLTADNGLNIDATNNIQLGGILIKPTIIETDATNILAIKNLQTGDIATDDIVTVDNTSGQLKKITASNLLKQNVTEVTANNNQFIFNSSDGLTLYASDKINVYRNGVRVDFTVENNNTEIKLEPDAKCYAGDQIRIVQLY